MNDEARDVLVHAALAGKVQVTGALHAMKGNCVLGELHVAYHQGSEAEARACEVGYPGLLACMTLVYTRFGITGACVSCPICLGTLPEAIVLAEHLNDLHQLSFLDIARKAP